MSTPRIAIVGAACRYPDARTPAELWENVLAGRRAFRRIPPERLALADYGSSDRAAADFTYGTHAAVLDGYEFDRVRFRVSGATFRSVDLTHWLALDVAHDALADAGYPDDFDLPRARTAVLVGNTLTGEFSRASTLRLRWPYVRRVVDAVLADAGDTADRRARLLPQIEVLFKAPFAPPDGDTLAGGLSNTIAGRICNYFDLQGGGYTVDGACASSLLAVAQACASLAVGDADVALAGGVDLSLDPFELVGFSRAGALASDDMRVYDAAPTGFWPGEGCGFVVLMREADAVAQRRRIYAVIRGWGMSSDGSGGLTRPELGGQLLALERAYARAGFGAGSVAYFEGHGTGTAVGDATELAALSAARRNDSAGAVPAAIGSIKANIGHTKAAAGLAGLIKAMLAVHHGILPPTCGCRDPHPALKATDAPLRAQERAERWPASSPPRAGVSAMGFGGINVHVVLEGGERHTQERRFLEGCARAWQDAELFLFAGNRPEDVRARIERVSRSASALSIAELTDLAVYLQQHVDSGPFRVAVVASNPGELVSRLSVALGTIDQRITRCDLRDGVVVGAADRAPRIGFLFSGQAAPVRTGGGLWSRRYADVDELYRAASLPQAAHASDTSIGQPAIVTASLAALRRFEELGLCGDVAIGHSLGELTALRWGGVLGDDESPIELARVRGRLMADLALGPGAMAALATSREVAETLIDGTSATIAGVNAPRQTTVSGTRASVDAVMARARERGVGVTPLAVACAFHSPLMAPVAPAYRDVLRRMAFDAPRRPGLISTITGEALTARDDVRTLLEQQLCSPVRFADALAAAGRVDLFVELGPGHTLATLAASSSSAPAVSVDAAGSSLRPFLVAVGAAFALGAPVRAQRLAEGRFARPFDLDRRRAFLANPCELAPESRLASSVPDPAAALGQTPAPHAAPEAAPSDAAADACVLLRSLVARVADLPIETIESNARFLSDLHLNSITVAELLVEACRALGTPPLAAPTDFADASLAEAARALDGLRASGPVTTADGYAGLDSWVRAFTVVDQEQPLPPPVRSVSGEWRIVASPNHPLRESLRAVFADRHNGPGTVVCMDASDADASTSRLVDAAKAALRERESARFLVVQQEAFAGGFARSLFLESGALDVGVVTVSFSDPDATARIHAEAGALAGFVDARYDLRGRRTVPVALLSDPTGSHPRVLGPDDVLLVTGGGKGIAAECALALARECGVRLAILGRSRPEGDAVLAANLERMRAAGAIVRYEAADVTEGSAVRQAVERLRAVCGDITAVLHAAGVNDPALIASLDDRAIQATLRPKFDGARNVLEACDRSRLKLFVTFGSIIARTGLRGEAHYALANERLREFTARLARELSDCRVLTIEWSVWSETGMGERLGRLDSLARQGVAPIALEDGIALFKALVGAAAPGPSVIATGRFGDRPTLRVAGASLPFSRFLETPRVYYPGVELVADATLSTTNDPYLADHRLNGRLLFPAVMGVEAMVQAAAAVHGGQDLPMLEHVEFSRPVVVPLDAPLVIRTIACAEPDGRVRVRLRSAATDFAVDHFKATCSWPSAPVEAIAASVADDAAGELDPDATRALYGSLLFQSGRFARLRQYRRIFATECVADVEAASSDWFGAYLPGALLLGDAGARDAALHCVQASVPHRRVVPATVERIAIRRPFGGLCRVRARQRDESGDTFTWDVEVLGSHGEIVEQWQGLRFRGIAPLATSGLPAPLLGPYVERQLAALGHVPATRVLVSGAPAEPARTGAGRALADAIAIGTRVRPDGRPEGARGTALSAAHTSALTMAITAPDAVGCDVEPIAERPPEVWRDLLGSDRASLAGLIARERAEPYAAGATRVWAAVESLKKAGAAAGAPLVLDRVRDDGWVTLRAGRYAVSTWVADTSADRKVALAVATGGPHAGI